VDSIQPLYGLFSQPIERGRLYAFDRHGKLLWPAAVKIQDQFMLAKQPSRLPLLTFVCQIRDERMRTKTSLLCIDKRSGRTLYKEMDKPTNILRIVGDAEKKTVELVMQHDTVTLKFTD
jgi:hypothetical protein